MRKLLLFLALAVALPAFGQTPLFSVTAQSANYTDSTGQVWTPQKQCTGGKTYVMAPVQAISGTLPAAADQKLYNAEYYGGINCTFGVPNGTYSVRLKFAEIWYGSSNSPCNPCTGIRVFNVSVSGVQVLQNFDIVAAAGGPLKAIDKVFTATVTNGTLPIAFSYNSANQDNPKFDAIQITPTSPANTPPTILQQPTSQTAFPGNTATFSVVANGTAPLAYQWQKNGATITGANAASYTTPPVQASDNAATFDAIVSNSVGSVQSVNAFLTVSQIPASASTMTISGTDTSGNPVSITVDPSKTITMHATFANGFQVNGTVIPQQITSVTPSQGPGGTQITIVGTGFLPQSTVTLICPGTPPGGGTSHTATIVSQSGSTQIIATVPSLTFAQATACDVRVDP